MSSWIEHSRLLCGFANLTENSTDYESWIPSRGPAAERPMPQEPVQTLEVVAAICVTALMVRVAAQLLDGCMLRRIYRAAQARRNADCEAAAQDDGRSSSHDHNLPVLSNAEALRHIVNPETTSLLCASAVFCVTGFFGAWNTLLYGYV